MKTFLLSAFFLLLGGLFPHPLLVLAESNQGGLTVSPLLQEVNLAPSDKQSDFTVALTNHAGTLMTLRLSLLDFGSLDESGGVAFVGADNNLERKYALSSWMRPEKDVVTINPGETQNVKITIENREGLGPGGHYGAITFRAGGEAEDPNVSNEVAINQIFTVLVFVKKLGGEVYHLGLKEIEAPHSIVTLPDTVRLRFQNSGNVHVVPRGIVTVTDPLGRIVEKGIINEESGLILPETQRLYPIHPRSLLWSFVPGRYTLAIQWRYDGKDDFSLQTTTFDFLPLFAIIGFLLMIVMIGWYGVRRRRKMGEYKPTLTDSP